MDLMGCDNDFLIPGRLCCHSGDYGWWRRWLVVVVVFFNIILMVAYRGVRGAVRCSAM